MGDALGADELVSDAPDILTRAPNDRNFQAMLGVQMYMQGGNDPPIMLMLERRQASGELADMVVIHDGYCPHHLAVVVLYSPRD